MNEDPKAISAPISIIYGMSEIKNPRKRCGVKSCRKPLNVATIEANRIRIQKKRGPGRPKKGEREKKRGRVVIGHYCKHCHIFYYPDGTPNYKLRLMPEPIG